MKGALIICLFLVLPCFSFAQVTIIIDKYPVKTSQKDTLYFSSSINHWNPRDKKFAFKKDNQGRLYLSLTNSIDSFEYKISRGSWMNVEVDSLGNDIRNRYYTKSLGNEVILKVKGWRDFYPKKKSRISKGVSFLPTNIEIPQLNRKRTIRMYFPPNYSSGKRFPVIYMHDGQNLFDDATAFSGEWNVDETLDSLYTYYGFSCIVVGIYHGDKERVNEMSPWVNDSLKVGGDGDKYAKFIIKTLKPFIDSHFRTLPDRENTAIMGSSMGGLISLYMALEYQDVFGKAGVFSPSFWFSPKAYEQIQKFNQKKYQRLYLLSGAKEGFSVVGNTLRADSLLRSVGFDENYMRCKISKDGQHSEWFWSREFGDAIKFLFNL